MKIAHKQKRKAGLWPTVTVMGALVAGSCFSLVAFAESSIDSKKDVVITEAQPPKEMAAKAEGKQPASQSQPSLPEDTEMVFPVNMDRKQADPFIKAAQEAFKTKNITLPKSGYWISSKYMDNKTKDVQIDWYPDSFDGLGPMNFIDDKVYFVYFTNVDLEKGTGSIQQVSVIEKGGFAGATEQK
ncbi:hypothetical protein [Brevibacillus borstelensis]|uniref:hypothetical protein n=1 Tax=Brevibacillus borstelensis TaxID=45462 RepID=UPI0030C168CF